MCHGAFCLSVFDRQRRLIVRSGFQPLHVIIHGISNILSFGKRLQILRCQFQSASDARFRMVNGVPTKVAEAKEGYHVDVPKSLQDALQAIDAYTGGDRLQVDLEVAVTTPTLTDADLSTVSTPVSTQSVRMWTV